jgi:hypothetical protein
MKTHNGLCNHSGTHAFTRCAQGYISRDPAWDNGELRMDRVGSPYRNTTTAKTHLPRDDILDNPVE